MSKVAIIGGGIIGLSSAYFLREAGFDVSVIDQGNLQQGCSFGNAGMIVPSHAVPLAAPGMIANGIRWMFKSRSPFYLKPRLNGELLRWGYQFYKHANKKHVENSIPALRDISLFSKSIYCQWSESMPFNFGYRENGLFMLFQTAEAESEERETIQQLAHFGIEAQMLGPGDIQKMEPDVRVSARGGVYYPGDAHVNPGELMTGLVSLLKQRGVNFILNTEVEALIRSSGKVVGLKTDKRDIEIESLVVASGTWSSQLLSSLSVSIPMQAGKGYSFTLPNVKKNVRIPTIFLEHRVAVTPMGDSLRFGGTMELTGINNHINMNRVQGIVDSIPHYYPEMKVTIPAIKDIWQGLRPCSPDGLPYIGRLRKTENVVVATGHAMMGLSLGAGTGKIVSEIMGGKTPGVDISRFDPERFN